MKGDRKNLKQFKAILKKDVSLLFRKRVAIFVFGGPFILMFILLGIPALFTSQQAVALLVFNEDIGYNQNEIGEAIIGNLSIYFASDGDIAIEVVANVTVVQQTAGLGLYVPSNFSQLAYEGIPIIYTVDATQSLFSSSTFNIINSIATKVMTTFLANRTINDVQNIQLPAAALPEELILGPKAAALAMPLSYMIFLLIALNSGSYSLIGFAREKRMRTMETLLAYSYKHSLLVISKVITGIIASLGTTLSYFLGILVGTQLGGESSSGELFELFGLNIGQLGASGIVISLVVVILALLISTLVTMAVDCNMKREASERVSPLISIGLAMFFYFIVMMNPLGISSALMINPFYWCYRLGLLIIAGKFNYEAIIFLLLIAGLIAVLIMVATRGIQKEKSLYLE